MRVDLETLGNIKYTNVWIIGVPEETKTGNLFKEIMTENFPNLAKETDIQDQKAQNPKQEEPK